MSIRVKLALVLTAGMAAASLASALVFIQLQRRAFLAAEEEKVGRLMEDVARIGGEASFLKDPLMLLDYLASLRRARPEVLGCRVLLNGRWQEVAPPQAAVAAAGRTPPPRGPPGSPAGPAEVEVRAVRFPSPDGEPGKEAEAEIRFSRAVLAQRERAAFSAMRRDLGVAVGAVVALAVLASLWLGWRMARRILRIEAAIEEIGSGRLGASVPVAGSDEVARLALGVNAMSERLRELELMKKTFVASVTHELRSPLGAIESYVRSLLSDPGRWSPEDRRNLERIRDNAARLEHFVSSLLEMARIERGKLDMRPRPSDPGALAEDVALFFRARAGEAGISLACEVEPGLPRLSLDPDLISQVLTNLVSNALKFTRKGGSVRVTARLAAGAGPARGGTPARPPPGNGAWVECAVEDTGVGIPAEALGRIFAPFERVRNPLKAAGTGLGLAISKTIVEMHGGTIGAASEPGRGSRFFFLLPPAAPAPGAKQIRDGAPLY